MYNSITGIITAKNSNQICILNNGIEYSITVSESCLNRVPAVENEYRILVYLHHREDQFSLFGFYSEEERELFFELIKVSGIGPKQAVKILSGMSVENLLKAMEIEDIDSLTRIQGLGRKTAEKIVLALRGRLVGRDAGISESHMDLVQALSNMGFDKKQAADAVRKIFLDAEGSLTEDEVIKQAIVRLSS